jgi:serine/threonine protein kinase
VSEIIQLSDDLIIGTGRDRICYEHPTIKEQCIKTSISSHKQSRREVQYFSFLTKRNVNLSHISVFLGNVQTSQGIGFCFELVRNVDGEISFTLRESLEKQIVSLKEIQPKLEDLKKYLMSNGICIRDISPSNIICQNTTEGINLIVIDGIGNPNINPLTIRLPRLIDSAISKAWKSLDKKLARVEKTLHRTGS